MDFRYADYFRSEPNVGYETLIYDCLIGDPTLFQRADKIEAAWRVVQPVLDAWAADNADVNTYMSGSAGPLEADGLLARSGNFAWRTIEVAAKRQS